jgi:hypothetical protein
MNFLSGQTTAAPEQGLPRAWVEYMEYMRGDAAVERAPETDSSDVSDAEVSEEDALAQEAYDLMMAEAPEWAVSSMEADAPIPDTAIAESGPSSSCEAAPQATQPESTSESASPGQSGALSAEPSRGTGRQPRCRAPGSYDESGGEKRLKSRVGETFQAAEPAWEGEGRSGVQGTSGLDERGDVLVTVPNAAAATVTGQRIVIFHEAKGRWCTGRAISYSSRRGHQVAFDRGPGEEAFKIYVHLAGVEVDNAEAINWHFAPAEEATVAGAPASATPVNAPPEEGELSARASRRFPGDAITKGYVEYEWRPGDDERFAEAVSQYVPAWLMACTALPIIITFACYADADERPPTNMSPTAADEWHPPLRWRAYMVACESMALAMASDGSPPQMGLYMLVRRAHTDPLAYLDGADLGAHYVNSTAYGDIERRHTRSRHSYLYCTEVSGRRAQAARAMVRVWDGCAGRAGGMKCANDPRGLSRPPNAVYDFATPGEATEVGLLRAAGTIAPVTAQDGPQDMGRKELLWRYGWSDRMWEAALSVP